MGFLTREQILGKKDLEIKKIYVKEWGGDIYIRSLSSYERDTMGEEARSGVLTPGNLRAKMASLIIVDKEGNRLFTEADIKSLGEKSAKSLDYIFDEGQKLMGVSEEDVDESIKNSESQSKDISSN